MTFKEVVPLLSGREYDAGLVIFQAVLENRIQNKIPYEAGREQQFLNLERQRVLRGLERLAAGEQTVPSPEALAKEFGDSRLNKHRPIERVKYLYDGLKFRYQMIRSPETDADKISTTSEFAQAIVFAIPTPSEDLDPDAQEKMQYRLERESDREEYVRMLERMQRRLSRLSGIIFYDRK